MKPSMSKADHAIVVAAYSEEHSVDTAIECLEKSEFRSEEVSLVRRRSDEEGDTTNGQSEPSTTGDTMADAGAVGGGAAIGGAAGLMAASTLMGPLLVAGPLAGVLAGGVAGATAAAIADHDDEASLAAKLNEMVRDGSQLIVVRSSPSRVVDAEAILATTNPQTVRRLG